MSLGGKPTPAEPSELLVKFQGLLPANGLALDVACGSGRNSVFLAEHGLRVLGVDRSWEALQEARKLAEARRFSVFWVLADLESFSLPPATFDAIVCFYYRDPALYPAIRESLRPGGLLFYETYTREQLAFGKGPRNPAHLLEPGELLNTFADWQAIFYRETWLERGVASSVTRKPSS